MPKTTRVKPWPKSSVFQKSGEDELVASGDWIIQNSRALVDPGRYFFYHIYLILYIKCN